jgi:hypothetical protein
MRRSLVILLLAVSCLAKSPPKKKAASPVSVAKTLLQMERDWSQAGIKRDSKTMDRILADDWVSTDFHGKSVTKAQALSELQSATAPAQPIELGDMKVKVFGNAAVVSGTDASGKYAWMDVFVKRDGRWQAVASQSAKIEK